MQVRFDGDIGFPGGLIEPEDESLTAGLNREVVEEMGSSSPSLKFEESDFLFAHRCLETGRVLYFYAKRISPEEFRELELNVLKAEEYGREVSFRFEISRFLDSGCPPCTFVYNGRWIQGSASVSDQQFFRQRQAPAFRGFAQSKDP